MFKLLCGASIVLGIAVLCYVLGFISGEYLLMICCFLCCFLSCWIVVANPQKRTMSATESEGMMEGRNQEYMFQLLQKGKVVGRELHTKGEIFHAISTKLNHIFRNTTMNKRQYYIKHDTKVPGVQIKDLWMFVGDEISYRYHDDGNDITRKGILEFCVGFGFKLPMWVISSGDLPEHKDPIAFDTVILG